MSRAFNSGNESLVGEYERELGFNVGDVANNPTLLNEFISATRTAWDKYLYLAFKGEGKWQYDDSSHEKYPIIYTNLVSGQQDYTFTEDEQGNLILDIYKVMVLPNATATIYEEIKPVDQQESEGFKSDDSIAREVGTGGVPYRYDKTARGIFLDPIPNYNADDGLKLFINREANYFTSSDTTKKPGCPGIHHDYFYLRPAMVYARRNNLSNFALIRDEVIKFEGDEQRGIPGSIEKYFTRRSKDERPIYQPEPIVFE